MADLPELDVVEQRVLGALLEKQVTVPAAYPLTFNALRTACNQSSSRDPVMDLDEARIEATTRTLRERGLVRIVWADSGRRTRKCHQILDEVLPLDGAERALVTVLMLRGAQSPGELETRTERLHPFADRAEVETCLHRLAGRTPPLVRRLERRPGQRDHRWMHLLGPDAGTGATAGPEESVVDRETPLAAGAEARDRGVTGTYAHVAQDYADAFTGELAQLPFERWLLDRVVAEAAGRPIVDAGCGPGHVTAHLAAAGADAQGLDLTPAMIEQARSRYPQVRYEVGDLRRLLRPEAAGGWGAVLGWYSLIHLAGSELPEAMAALSRPLEPGGVLVLGLHAGRGVRRVTTWFERDVELDLVLHEPEDVVAVATSCGLTDVEWYRRGPIAARRETTDRLYLLARRPPA
jgi:hypothetical protein